MKSCVHSLCSLVLALGLGVFATGCFAQSGANADVDVDADTTEALPGSEAQGVDEDKATDPQTAAPEDGSDGLCTSPTCTQV